MKYIILSLSLLFLSFTTIAKTTVSDINNITLNEKQLDLLIKIDESVHIKNKQNNDNLTEYFYREIDAEYKNPVLDFFIKIILNDNNEEQITYDHIIFLFFTVLILILYFYQILQNFKISDFKSTYKLNMKFYLLGSLYFVLYIFIFFLYLYLI